VFAAHGISGDFLRLTQIVSTNIHKINQNGMINVTNQVFFLWVFTERHYASTVYVVVSNK